MAVWLLGCGVYGELLSTHFDALHGVEPVGKRGSAVWVPFAPPSRLGPWERVGGHELLVAMIPFHIEPCGVPLRPAASLVSLGFSHLVCGTCQAPRYP